MAEKSAVDVLNAHHGKLNNHTIQLNEHATQLAALQERINKLEASGDLGGRVAKLEEEHKPIRDFLQKINDWVGSIKD